MVRLEERIRRLTIALERLDTAWRREHSLTANEQLVVTSLAADGPLSPTRLSERTGLSSAGTSALIDRLEAEGHVARRRDPNDGRRVLVTLTKRALVARMALDEVIAEIATQVDQSHAPHIERFLDIAERVALDRARQLGAPAT
ncbi:MAG: transcriptional regulator, MarR family [Thermoleophilia bacterium]|nr:transcriptional regulator, MarR family [Thermoleophilia bacterium]